MSKFKTVCVVDKCTTSSKEEEITLFITAGDAYEAERTAKYHIIDKGWCVITIKSTLFSN
jgi:hypothetical protein